MAKANQTIAAATTTTVTAASDVEKKTYRVLTPIKDGDTSYDEFDTIDLDEKSAKELLAIKAIRVIESLNSKSDDAA